MLKQLIEDLRLWADANFIQLNKTAHKQIFEIPEFGKVYIVLPVDGILFDEDLYFIFDDGSFEDAQLNAFVESKEVDYLVFCFGKCWYYCKPVLKKDAYNEMRFVVDFADLKYVGTNTLELGLNCSPLGIHTEYEILNGNGLKNYMYKAKFFKYTHVGMCDRNTLAGTLAFQTEAKKMGLKSVLGMTIAVAVNYKNDDEVPITYELKLYVKNFTGWQNLLQISRYINVEHKGFITEQELRTLQEGLICVVGFQSDLNFKEKKQVVNWLLKFKKFEVRYFQFDCSEFFAAADDLKRLDVLNDYLKGNYLSLLPPILLNDIYYCDKEQYIIKDYLNKAAKKANDYSEDQYFKSLDEINAQMSVLFTDADTYVELLTLMLKNLDDVCQACGAFQIETGIRRLPVYESEDGKLPKELFKEVVLQGFEKKVIQRGLDVDKYFERLQIELKVIMEGELESYFLILWDICKWCQENGIMVGPGRGSAAGSLVMHCMSITEFDPIPFDLLFERFLNRTRVLPQIKYEVTYNDGSTGLLDEQRYKEAKEKNSIKVEKQVKIFQGDGADVDIDFQSNMRDYVKEYIKYRFGTLHSCNIGTFVNFQPRGCLKIFGGVKGLKFSHINFITKAIPNKPTAYTFRDFVEYAAKSKDLKEFFQNNPEIIYVSKHVLDQPITQSIHASGVLVLPKHNANGEEVNIYNWLPVREMEGKLVSEWEGGWCDTAGFLKEDILALTELAKFKNILGLIKENHGKDIDLDNLPLNDQKTYKLFQQGFNEDVFQFNSGGLKAYSKKVKPDQFEDLIAMNALYRPGPMESNAHIDYALMKHGKKESEFDYGLESVTKHTQGLYIYQEQAMLALVVLGGFTLIESDDFRKKIKKFLRNEMVPLHDKFIAGAKAKGCEEKEAEKIWNKLLAFGNYGFNKCIQGDMIIYRFAGNWSPKEISVKDFYEMAYGERTTTSGKYRLQGHLGYVRHYNVETKKIQYALVKKIHKNGVKQLLSVELKNGMYIVATKEHRLMNGYEEYKAIGDLKIGDKLITCGEKIGKQRDLGYYAETSEIVNIEFVGEDMTYDLEMFEEPHNYIANGIVSHNSHSATYAKIAYQTQWLKAHYPLEFWTTAIQFAAEEEIPAMMSEMGKLKQGITIKPPEVNNSDVHFQCDPSDNTIYWSLAKIKGLGPKTVPYVINIRKKVQFESLEDFCARVPSKVNKGHIEKMIMAGCFDLVENIKHPSHRLSVLRKYAALRNYELPEKFKQSEAQKDYWWVLIQKELTGFGAIDFKQLIGLNKDAKKHLNKYVSPEMFQKKQDYDFVMLAGQAVDIFERRTKKGDTFIILTLQNNNENMKILIWSDFVTQFVEVLEGCEGKMLYVTGKVRFDNYNQNNSLHMCEESTLAIL